MILSELDETKNLNFRFAKKAVTVQDRHQECKKLDKEIRKFNYGMVE